MRTVVPTPEVYHLWANEAQDHARNAGHSARFHGAIAYSYQTPIARIVRRPDGERAYLVTARSYSMTTSSKHMPALRRAIGRGRLVFNVMEVGRGGWNDYDNAWSAEAPEREVIRYAERIAELDAKAKRARVNGNRPWYEQQAAEMRAEANSYCQFFGIAAEFSSAVVERLTREQEHARALRLEREREREMRAEEERARRVAEAVPLWRSHAISHRSALQYDAPVMLRVSQDGTEIETSHGARVPIDAAETAYNALERGMNIVGLRCGAYTVREVTPEEIVIGCHRIPRAEIAQLASSLHWGESLVARA